MKNAGLYIHIPFCQKKCGYCDFYSITALHQIEDFLDSLQKEIELLSSQYAHWVFDTVFIGGGTPTVLSEKQLEVLWRQIHRHFRIADNAEITIEANPGTINYEKLKFLRALGINRLSMGVQSFFEEDLRFLGRIHRTDDVLNNYEAARKAQFSNINLDLMTAFPGLSPQRFENTLLKATQLQPEHISCYTLIFEPKTPFYVKMKKGLLKPLDQETEAIFYQIANNILSENGYTPYEISKFALTEDLRCKHNLKYWNHQPYLGLGPSAHSFIQPKRWWNIQQLHDYIRSLRIGKLPVAGSEELDQSTLEFEYIFLHLRLKDGINLEEFNRKFHVNFFEKYKNTLDKLIKGGFIEQFNDRVVLSSRGWLLADEVAQDF